MKLIMIIIITLFCFFGCISSELIEQQEPVIQAIIEKVSLQTNYNFTGDNIDGINYDNNKIFYFDSEYRTNRCITQITIGNDSYYGEIIRGTDFFGSSETYNINISGNEFNITGTIIRTKNENNSYLEKTHTFDINLNDQKLIGNIKDLALISSYNLYFQGNNISGNVVKHYENRDLYYYIDLIFGDKHFLGMIESIKRNKKIMINTNINKSEILIWATINVYNRFLKFIDWTLRDKN